VNERPCPRCRSLLTHPGDSTLVFCWNCGAPQVLLSEDLKTQAELIGQPGALDPTTPPPPTDPTAIVWSGAINLALLAGAVAALLDLASLLLPGLDIFALLWAFGAPIIVLGVYSSRFRTSRIQPVFGARLGLLCGLAIVLASSVVAAGRMLFERLVYHAAGPMPDFVAQLRTQANTQYGHDAPFLQYLGIPEFQVGLLFASMAFTIGIYLVLSMAGGAFTGFLRSRARTT